MSQTVEIQKQNAVLRIPGRYQTANIFVNKKHIRIGIKELLLASDKGCNNSFFIIKNNYIVGKSRKFVIAFSCDL